MGVALGPKSINTGWGEVPLGGKFALKIGRGEQNWSLVGQNLPKNVFHANITKRVCVLHCLYAFSMNNTFFTDFRKLKFDLKEG